MKEKLQHLRKFGQYEYDMDRKEMILESENDGILVRLIFTNLVLTIKQDSIGIQRSDAMLFLKQK